MTETTLEGIVSGYRAELTDEGLVLYDVPIFCACAFDAGGSGESKPLQFDELWVKAAFKKAMRRQTGDYKPPMHIRHHDRETAANDSVRKAGYFRIRRTGPITLDGQRRTAIYADLIFTDPNAQWEVRTNQLNYRSVEIHDYTAEASIDGLALLDHEAPHLELPMLQVAGPVEDKRTDQAVANANFQTRAAPARRGTMVCFRRAGTKAYVTFKDDSTMKTPEQIAEEAEAAEAARIANLGGTETRANLEDDKDKDANMEDDKDDKDANMEDDDKDKDADMMEGENGIDWAAVAKALESGEVMQKDLDMVLAAIQNQTPAEEETITAEEEKEPIQQVSTLKARTPELVAMAKLQGQVDALQAAGVQRDTREKRVSEVARALVRLKGMPLGADLQGKLVKFHKAHGGAAFGDYVESLAQNTVIDPGERSDQAKAAFKALGGKVPAIAMKYQSGGTEDVHTAAAFCREYRQLQEAGAGSKLTEEQYVKNNMARAESAAAEAEAV